MTLDAIVLLVSLAASLFAGIATGALIRRVRQEQRRRDEPLLRFLQEELPRARTEDLKEAQRRLDELKKAQAEYDAIDIRVRKAIEQARTKTSGQKD
ncbi:hypothetical protein [Sorangium sp. So ce117]|uniref:hypothetical protein n=1 Tax=Sorangium sp. So ce117 TaxID=3133277 RepID=UPI003F607F22